MQDLILNTPHLTVRAEHVNDLILKNENEDSNGPQFRAIGVELGKNRFISNLKINKYLIDLKI